MVLTSCSKPGMLMTQARVLPWVKGSSPYHLLSSRSGLDPPRGLQCGEQLHVKDDCWCIDELYKLKPNKVHSKEVQYVKVHHEEVHHKEVHHEEVQIKLQQINDADC